ncbi:MAG: hypothetical protein ABL891_13665 [Burkholderiales bacterium]
MKIILMAALAVLPTIVLAQQKAPVAQYWMSVETAAGMNIPGMSGMAGMMTGMMGGQQQSGRKMSLQLGSQRPADAPTAAHEIPAGMSMGPSLPLLSPRTSVGTERAEREMPEGMERPKGRMLIYWGCGEATRQGQPVVIDFARAASGQMPAGFVARRVASGAAPSGRTTGLWPNQQDSKAVPDSASLIGDHAIRGNYTPDIRFALGGGHDFMARIDLVSSATGAGAALVRWNAPATATGYFATAVGSVDGNDIIFWSSSEVQESGGMLMDYVPPNEVARLIREKVVMPPQTTECTVPAEVVKKIGTPMLSFIAYGPEANFAQPPRPQDPQWAVKVRFKSTASTLLGDAGEARSGRPQRAEPSRSPGAPSGEPSAQPGQPAAPDPVKDGINILRGIFGR